MKRFEWVVLGVGLLIAVSVTANTEDVCMDTALRYGVAMRACPDGKIRQTAHITVGGLRRGAPGTVTIGATANYTTRDADSVESIEVRPSAVELSLVGADQAARPIAVERWRPEPRGLHAEITLPDVPDGEYRLQAKYDTRIGAGTLDVAVPLYTPARIHVITDRPLYEPGNTVKFRAVVLRARDLAPLDGRPGKWMVKDPQGEVVLEEAAPAGQWGVVSGTFPLDRGAPTGAWHVSWTSSDASDEVPFTVEPFTLPRFRVDAATARPFYRPGDKPTLKGSVVYSSGAPVAGAAIDIAWTFAGAWPPPTEWVDRLLPKTARTAGNGRFELTLPEVPADLQGQATMIARLSAVDPAGDRVEGAVPVLLSQDGIAVSAVTELGDGLVQGFNNRMYLRVTTADGGVVSRAKINVKRAWQATDHGIDAELDEDGVASLQLDPGAPVNVVIPAQPFRPTPRPPTVRRGTPDELIRGEGASLADQVEMDRWLAALVPCAKWVRDDSAEVVVGLRVDARGAVVTAGAAPGSLERCVVDVLRRQRLPAGDERMFRIGFRFDDPELSTLTPEIEGALAAPEGLAEQIDELARSTRDCLPLTTGDGPLPSMLAWRSRAGAREVELGGWLRDPRATGATPAAMACATARIGAARIALAEPAVHDALGLVRFTVELPARMTEARPQPTTMLGYELVVTAEIEGRPSTRLRVTPGEVPRLRLRVNPILARRGDTVVAELIRGPEFAGELPRELELGHRRGKPVTAKLDADRRAKFTIAPDVEGWVEIRGAGLRALVYVKPDAELSVSVQAKQDRYAPRDQAELQLRTLVGGKGGPAAVGLFGVDASLGQLVPLRGPDDMARVQPKVDTGSPAFGVLDGQALTLGRIRGANAAAATVLRVTAIPEPPQLDATVDASAATRFDAVEELTDRFYAVLAELHDQARAWEAGAPPGEKMRPATLAALWTKALAACAQRGERVDDAYGRRLRLRLLPPDLLALTDPRAVVVVGTRLPEDVENWAEWVAKEKP